MKTKKSISEMTIGELNEVRLNGANANVRMAAVRQAERRLEAVIREAIGNLIDIRGLPATMLVLADVCEQRAHAATDQAKAMGLIVGSDEIRKAAEAVVPTVE